MTRLIDFILRRLFAYADECFAAALLTAFAGFLLIVDRVIAGAVAASYGVTS